MKLKIFFLLFLNIILLSQKLEAGVSTILNFDRFDAEGPNAGEWYKNYNNDQGTLAWGESYVMMAYAKMYETTGERFYLDKLAEHADAVLEQRDDVRGVTDYTGNSNPCWQASKYSTRPMCWVVHSGMITYPIAMFAVYVFSKPNMAVLTTYDGTSYADKASFFLNRVIETYNFHEGEWRNSGTQQGYYIFPADSASFYEYANQKMPLNQMNAMGRTAIALYLATNDSAYLERATRLANHFKANLHTGSGDTYVWNYWGGNYSLYGEDISHATINVGFAALCAEHGIVFSKADMERFGRTFYENVIIDHKTNFSFVGGGSSPDDRYRHTIGGWGVLGKWDPRVIAAIRNVYDRYTTVSNGAVLLGFAYLAFFDFYIHPFTFYRVDWNDLGDRRQATAYGANVSLLPDNPSIPAFFRMKFVARRNLEVEQWDGSSYHGVQKLASTSEPEAVLVPFDPRWYFQYNADGALFQFTDSFVPGEGIIVYEPEECNAPQILSSPPDVQIQEGNLFSFTPLASGDEPMLWFLNGPITSQVDRMSGNVRWIADFQDGDATFALTVKNDCGESTINWVVKELSIEEEPVEVENETIADFLNDTNDILDTKIYEDVQGDLKVDTNLPAIEGNGCGCIITK